MASMVSDTVYNTNMVITLEWGLCYVTCKVSSRQKNTHTVYDMSKKQIDQPYIVTQAKCPSIHVCVCAHNDSHTLESSGNPFQSQTYCITHVL